ncbi:hypothetical protein [Ruminococcus sp. HUN007]|uniref:hypothetical protein n=1 Tax=Ruminococcus sp. HUN007 TaxID=1514668 RepID=UPI0006795EE6|nr:hypothetical protein [Ruminococcus sp. HUN007]
MKNLVNADLIRKAENRPYLCVSYRDEADTLKLIEYLLSEGISTAVPRCRKQGEMDFFMIKSFEDFKPSFMGIPEPEYDETPTGS